MRLAITCGGRTGAKLISFSLAARSCILLICFSMSDFAMKPDLVGMREVRGVLMPCAGLKSRSKTWSCVGRGRVLSCLRRMIS